MTEEQRKELENRAAIVVRGCSNPDSGWYDSPDDLQAVIEGQLAAVWAMAQRAAFTGLSCRCITDPVDLVTRRCDRCLAMEKLR